MRKTDPGRAVVGKAPETIPKNFMVLSGE